MRFSASDPVIDEASIPKIPMRHTRSVAALLVAALTSLSSAQDESAPGFSIHPLPAGGTGVFSATTTLENGDFVVFDGTQVVQLDAQGSFLQLLGSFPSMLFPSFLLADPDGLQLWLGESSNGGIYRLILGTPSSPELVATLPYNYDAAVSEPGALWVSAAAAGLASPSEIWRIDLAARTARRIARIPGASGPLAFDAAGNLLYGVVSRQFPPPPGSSSVVRWSRAQLRRLLARAPAPGQVGHAWLELSDAETIATGFTSAARLARDPRTDELFLAENDYVSGVNRLRRLRGSASASPILFEGRPGRTLGSLSFLPGPGAARFLAYQPSEGGSLVFTSADFVAAPERIALRPERPAADIHGPGTSGPGEYFLELSGGPPGGLALIAYGPRSTYSPMESAYLVGDLPLFLGLAPATLHLANGTLSLDGAGTLHASYVNPGGLEGRFALQLLLLDASGRLVGSSSAAFL